MSETNAVNILTKAREIVANGWYQGYFRSPGGGCFCAMGALSLAATNGEAYSRPPFYANRYGNVAERALFFLRNAVTGKIPTEAYGWHDIVAFNDSEKTQKRDVLKAFDVAICNARRRKTTQKPLRTAR